MEEESSDLKGIGSGKAEHKSEQSNPDDSSGVETKQKIPCVKLTEEPHIDAQENDSDTNPLMEADATELAGWIPSWARNCVAWCTLCSDVGSSGQEAEKKEENAMEQADSIQVIMEDLLKLPPDDSRDPSFLAQMGVGMLTTVLASIAMHKSYTFLPGLITVNLLWEETFCFRLLASAVTTAFLFQAPMPLINRRFLASRTAWTAGEGDRYTESRGWVAVTIGAVLIGIGMGACLATPETAVLQIGEGMLSGVAVVSGLILGAVIFAAIESLESFQRFLTKCRPSSTFLDMSFGWSYVRMAIAAATICAFFLRALHLSVTEVLPVDMDQVSHFRWSPYTLGILLGILQQPLRCYCRAEFDGARGFQSLVNRVTSLCLSLRGRAAEETGIELEAPLVDERNKPDEFESRKHMPTEVFIISPLIVGLCALPTVDRFATCSSHQSMNDVLVAFVGGIIQMLGARLANGSFIGHTLGGISDFRTVSFLVVPVAVFTACVTVNIHAALIK